MASSRADWVFGEARLISSPSTIVAKTGPGRNSNTAAERFQTVTPHDVGGQQVGGELDAAEVAVDRRGQRLGQGGLADAGHVLEQQVALRRPGTARASSTTSALPRIARPTAAVMVPNSSANVAARGSVSWVVTRGSSRRRGAAGCPPARTGYAARSASVPSGVVTNDLALAVDIGGTKLEVGLVDRDGVVVRRGPGGDPGTTRVPRTCSGRSPAWSATSWPPAADPMVCGVGTRWADDRRRRDRSRRSTSRPGGPSPSATGWPSSPGCPTFVDNDAKALALGEGWVGAARGCRDYLAMVVSTGVGGGIVLDGRLLDGADGNAGHIGHVIVEPDGHPCGCGASGCLEAEASGTAIAAITGRPAVRGRAGGRRRTGTLVGRAVASVANLLDLRLAVVAGSVALGFGEPFFAGGRGRDRTTVPPRLLGRHADPTGPAGRRRPARRVPPRWAGEGSAHRSVR